MYSESLVSIIMPLYNCENYVTEAIQSVVAQSYENWELIVVDDCSTDRSYFIVQDIMDDESRIKLHKMSKNSGVASVRNYATKEATGKYIAFLDCDDVWLPEKLEKQIVMMQKDKVFLSYAAYATIDENSNVTGLFNVSKEVTYDDMLKSSTIGTLTMVYNADELGKCYFKDIGHEDYVMKLELVKRIESAHGITEPLAKYRIVNRSLSRNKLKAALWQWKIYRNIEKLPLYKAIYYFGWYTFKGFFKYR